MTIYRITGTLIRSRPADTTYRYYLEAWDADISADDGLATAAVHIAEDEDRAPFTLLFSSDRLPDEDEEYSGPPEIYFKLFNIRNTDPPRPRATRRSCSAEAAPAASRWAPSLPSTGPRCSPATARRSRRPWAPQGRQRRPLR